jgi:hypothetical protein
VSDIGAASEMVAKLERLEAQRSDRSIREVRQSVARQLKTGVGTLAKYARWNMKWKLLGKLVLAIAMTRFARLRLRWRRPRHCSSKQHRRDR